MLASFKVYSNCSETISNIKTEEEKKFGGNDEKKNHLYFVVRVFVQSGK